MSVAGTECPECGRTFASLQPHLRHRHPLPARRPTRCAASCRRRSDGPDGLCRPCRDERLATLRSHGAEHPHALTIRHLMARWRAQAGDIDGAVVQLARLTGDRARVLGPTHVDTVATREALAYWRRRADDPT